MILRLRIHFVLLVFLTVSSIAFFGNETSIAQDEEEYYKFPIYERGAEALMKDLHEEWRISDGAGVFEVGDDLFWSFLLNPNKFYREFVEDTLHFNRFSKYIKYNAFFNWNDTTTAEYERLKAVAIWRLEEISYDLDSVYIDLHQDMILSIKNARISYVDAPY